MAGFLFHFKQESVLSNGLGLTHTLQTDRDRKWLLCAHVMGSMQSWKAYGAEPLLGSHSSRSTGQRSLFILSLPWAEGRAQVIMVACLPQIQGWEAGGRNQTHYVFQFIRLLVLCQAASPLSGITALCIIIYQHSGWLHSLSPFCCGTPLRLGFQCKAS